MEAKGPVTQWLNRMREGDDEALDRLVQLLYKDLRIIARSHLRNERRGHTLNATALVNEAYLRLSRNDGLAPENRGQFFLAASQTMRRILVDYARTRKRIKRGGGAVAIPLEEAELALTEEAADEVLAIDRAIEKLAEKNERAAQMISYRFFAGLTLAETAEILDVTVKTIQRDWTLARAWLRREVAQDM